MNRIIIDADPGVDDTFAILLAAKSPLIDLLGVTIVAGNCGLENGIRNAFKILDMCDKPYIPVYKGESESLEDRDITADYVHGQNGFGDLQYEPIMRGTSGDAVEYLIKTINDNPKQIDVVAVGPLTNIALAIMRDENFAKNIKSLLIMGSSKVRGNVTPYAEFNFYKDPHAAKVVFESDIKDIKVFGLNVTRKTTLKKEQEDYMKNSDNELANTLYKITRMGAEFDRKCGLDGLTLNDPVPIAYLIENNVVQMMKCDIEIIIEGERIGRSKVTLNENGKHNMAYDVDVELFDEILFETLFNENF